MYIKREVLKRKGTERARNKERGRDPNEAKEGRGRRHEGGAEYLVCHLPEGSRHVANKSRDRPPVPGPPDVRFSSILARRFARPALLRLRSSSRRYPLAARPWPSSARASKTRPSACPSPLPPWPLSRPSAVRA